MYTPEAFVESRPEVLQRWIREHAFGTLITGGAEGLQATHLPFLYDPGRGDRGTLWGHMARANPQWRAFADGGPVLAVFTGPHAYVSPSHYAADFAVPTWNYAAVHVCGPARVVDDESLVRQLLDDLVARYESGAEKPWTFSWADERYARMVAAIVAFEVEVTRIEGKAKLNQNRPLADQVGVVSALGASGRQEDRRFAAFMADYLCLARP